MKNCFTILFILVVGLFFTLVNVSAQSNIRVEESFDSNQAGWKEGENAQVSAKVDSGAYRIDVKKKGGKFFTTRQFFLPKDSSYLLTCSFEMDTAISEGFFGLIWGAKSGKDLFSLQVKDTLWALKEYVSGAGKTLLKGALKERPNGSYQFKIHRQKGTYTITINEELAYKGEVLELKGYHMGFVAFDPVSVDIHSLRLKTSDEIPLLVNLPIGLKKKNLGKAINSSSSEKIPIISPDGRHLFFSAQGENKLDQVYMAKRESKEKWGDKIKMPWPINLDQSSSGIFSISPDNNTLFMNGRYEDSVYVGTGISYITRGEKGWEAPTNIEIVNYKNEGDQVEHHLSADGKTLLHSIIDSRDSQGAYDLYVSFRINDSTWSQPMNLGKELNTKGDEISPFLSPDTRTLYFSTTGRGGFGSADIFVSRRLDESWTNWSTPQNLGPDVNTAEWDGYFSLDARGVFAYFTSKANSMGRADIFQMLVPPAARPQPVLILNGRVKDASTGKPLAAMVTCRDLLTDEVLGMARSAPGSGAYKIVLPKGRYYSFEAKREGFFAIRGNLDVSDLPAYREVRRDLALAPLEEGQNIVLNNVFFDAGDASLRKESTQELERVCQLLSEHPEMKVEVAGHADGMMETASNLDLSQKRADEVRRFILKCGLPGERVLAKGYGESKPMAKNPIEGQCRGNKRVELVISTF